MCSGIALHKNGPIMKKKVVLFSRAGVTNVSACCLAE
jgi:hypothetical protein